MRQAKIQFGFPFFNNQIKILNLDLHHLHRKIIRHDQSLEKISSALNHCSEILRKMRKMKREFK